MNIARRIVALLVSALMAYGMLAPAQAATTLLPNGKQCFSATTGLNGMIGLLGTITAGSGYVNGTYGNVPLTGGSGTTATANITVAGGVVTSVIVQNAGKNYVVGDLLSASNTNLGGSGAGFQVPVSSIAINASLAGGQVNMFVPNTTTVKPTWQDSGQVTLNSNPIILDGNGCAVIYGIGIYRQQLLDSLGNLIWDQQTTDTSATNNTFWAGNAGGTPNAITVVDVGFNATDGSIIQFLPTNTNTGPTTLNPSGFGNISVVKDTSAGAVALSGGEISNGPPANVVNVVYSASQNNFHILNLLNSSAPQSQQTMCGAIGLKITNIGAGTPNSQMLFTADQTTAINNSFQIASRTNVSYTLNITLGNLTSTVNGMDGEAPGTSSWIYVWAIDNGTQGGTLGSLSATAPTMPSGYSYKCRLGAIRVDGSGNLMRTTQAGNQTQYSPVIASNTTDLPTILSSNATAQTSWTSVSVANVVPPTATRLKLSLMYNGANATQVAVAPNNQFPAIGAGNHVSGTGGLCSFDNGVASTGIGSNQACEMVLESSNVYYITSSSAPTYGILAQSWTDKVNAN